LLCPSRAGNRFLITFGTAPFFCVCPVFTIVSQVRIGNDVDLPEDIASEKIALLKYR
jgi:hypothetical protein